MQYCNKLLAVFWIIITIFYIGIHRHYNIKIFASSACALFISVMQPAKGAQFLSIACLLFQSATAATLPAPAPTTVMSHLTSIYASR